MVNAMLDWLRGQKRRLPDPVPRGDEKTQQVVYSSLIVASDKAARGERLFLADYPGLLAYHHLVTTSGADQVASYWRSKDHFSGSKKRFSRALGLSAVVSEGYVLGIEKPRKRFWKRPGFWYGALLHVVAVLGAFEALERAQHWLFASPAMSVSLREGQPIHSLDGEPFRIKVEIANKARVGKAELVVDKALLTPTDRKAEGDSNSRMEWFPKGPILVEAGKSAEIELVGHGPPPGDYELTLTSRSKAGRLRSWTPNELFFLGFRSWSTLTWEPPVVESVLGDRCILRSVLLAGAGSSEPFEGEVVILHQPKVEIIGIVFPGTKQWSDPAAADSPGGEMVSVKWPVSSVGEFTETPFNIILKGPAGTDWEAVAEASVINFLTREANR